MPLETVAGSLPGSRASAGPRSKVTAAVTLHRAFQAVCRAWAHRRTRLRDRRFLRQLSDRDLADIGLVRLDLDATSPTDIHSRVF